MPANLVDILPALKGEDSRVGILRFTMLLVLEVQTHQFPCNPGRDETGLITSKSFEQVGIESFDDHMQNPAILSQNDLGIGPLQCIRRRQPDYRRNTRVNTSSSASS